MWYNWTKKFAGVTNLPIVTFNQNEQLLYSELSISTNDLKVFNHTVEGDIVGKLLRLPNGSEIKIPEPAIQRKGMIILGDSGNPAFLIHNGEPVLLYCLFRGWVGHGTSVHEHLFEIQSAMDELEPGYKLTFAD